MLQHQTPTSLLLATLLCVKPKDRLGRGVALLQTVATTLLRYGFVTRNVH